MQIHHMFLALVDHLTSCILLSSTFFAIENIVDAEYKSDCGASYRPGIVKGIGTKSSSIGGRGSGTRRWNIYDCGVLVKF